MRFKEITQASCLCSGMISAESHCIQTALTELFLFTDKQHLCVQITEISFTVRKVTFN